MTPTLAASAVDLDAMLGPHARRSADMEALWDWILDQDAGGPDWMTLPPAAARTFQDGLTRKWNIEQPPLEAVVPLTLGAEPAVPATLFVPKDARPGCILYLHGGGWAFGSTTTHERLMRLLATDTATRVLGVDYRLAPEHPFPAPFEDCLAAWRTLVERHNEPAFAGPLAIAGDSAGANLAAAVLLHEIAAERRKPDLGLLFYGVYDPDLDSASYRRFAEGFGLTRIGMARYWDLYAPPSISRRDYRVSPVHATEADLARLPPLYLNAAGLDPLLCDTIAFARRVEAAGARYALAIHDGVHHGFMQMSLRLPEARAAIRQAANFFVETIGK